MGRKNNKNKNKFKNQNQQGRQQESVEVIQTEKPVMIEVIEPEVIEPVTSPIEVIQTAQKVEEQPVMNSQPQIMAQPVMTPQPQVMAQPVVNPQPQVMAQPVVTPQPQVMAQPVVTPQPQVMAQPVMTPQPQVMEQPVISQPQIVEQSVIKEHEQPKKVNLLINKNPKSSFSEAIKSVRTNLQFSAVEKEIKLILVSSPEPGDGKSLISSNLAGAYAQENKKVLIIDCDLRKGRQAEIFGIKKLPTTGYTNLILNYNNLEKEKKSKEKTEEQEEIKSPSLKDYICETGITNVDLIPNGPTPPNPIELLSSTKNQELLNDLKDLYDIIILDCPPVLGLSDALVMTKYSDANIIVISKGKTKVESLAEVKKCFEKVNSSITGVITNKAKRTHNTYYGYYGE